MENFYFQIFFKTNVSFNELKKIHIATGMPHVIVSRKEYRFSDSSECRVVLVTHKSQYLILIFLLSVYKFYVPGF